MTAASTLLIHALPGATASAYFTQGPAWQYVLLQHPRITAAKGDVLAIHINGTDTKFKVNLDLTVSLPPMRLEGQTVRVTLRGQESPGSLQASVEPRKVAQATQVSPRPRSARGGPIEPSYGLSPRE